MSRMGDSWLGDILWWTFFAVACMFVVWVFMDSASNEARSYSTTTTVVPSRSIQDTP